MTWKISFSSVRWLPTLRSAKPGLTQISVCPAVNVLSIVLALDLKLPQQWCIGEKYKRHFKTVVPRAIWFPPVTTALCVESGSYLMIDPSRELLWGGRPVSQWCIYTGKQGTGNFSFIKGRLRKSELVRVEFFQFTWSMVDSIETSLTFMFKTSDNYSQLWNWSTWWFYRKMSTINSHY